MTESLNRRPMTILQVLPALVTGGVERGTVDLARALVAAGHRALVVSSGGPMVRELTECGATHIELPVHSKNFFQLRHNAKILVKLIREQQVDIVHVRSRAPAWSCYWATQKTGTPLVTTFHGTYSHGSWLKRWYNSVMCKGQRVIAVSNFIARHISQVYQIDQERLRTIHRGIDLQQFNPAAVAADELSELKQEWHIDPQQQVLMLPGRLTRWKGQTVAIDALAQLELDNTLCLLVGDDQGRTAYRQELEDRIEQRDLDDTIKLTGGCSTMAAAYQLADLVISASLEPEAFGRVACEAQAMGCLVVATEHGGARETIAPIQQPWLCDPNDADSMAQAIERALATTPEQRAEIARQSRAYIEQHFSLDKMCAETIALYRELLSA